MEKTTEGLTAYQVAEALACMSHASISEQFEACYGVPYEDAEAGYRAEKCGVLRDRGLLYLWGDLDPSNRARLIRRALARYRGGQARALVTRINTYAARCEEAEESDTGALWALLNEANEILAGVGGCDR